MHRRRALLVVVGAMVSVAVGVSVSAAPPGGYGDPDYLAFDLDNVSRSTGRQPAQLTDPAYHQAMMATGAESYLENLGQQLADLPAGRVYGGLGQVLPGGAVGDPLAYHDIEPLPVNFVTRTGAKLQGRLFWDGAPGAHPGVVITTGSLQGTQHMYWWAARRLARAGYLVLTWDVQGQGESEAFGHDGGSAVPTFDGFPSQQAANFVDGTIDAVRFFLSTPDAPYLPQGWSEADGIAAGTAADADSLSWSNPMWGALDPTRLGIAGHSLGAHAVSVVQQCSDEGDAWQTEPACGGQSFPIRAVVGWDSLSDSVTPVVPAMDQAGDGYFLAPGPSPNPPQPSGHLNAFTQWVAAGLDTYALSVRGGTHLEWTEIPFLLPATTYGTALADHYTLLWFERWVPLDPARRAAAAAALRADPFPDGATGGATELPWRANFFSARFLSAFSVHDTDGTYHEAVDLRAYAGLSPVGDWAGANADRPAPRL